MKLNPENPMYNPETNWKDEYAKQRKNRLEDAIHDYLDDADSSILEFYHDLQDILVDMVAYHKKFGEKAAGVLLMVHGKSPTEKEETAEFLTENETNKYSYEADITLQKIKEFQRGTSL